MHRAAQALLGEHDFSAFRTVHCQAPHARRDLQAVSVTRQDDVVEVQVQANAFLHHMVRNIVGSLLLVGRGEQAEDWIAQVCWPAATARVPGPTAPPDGLVFLGPLYPRPNAACPAAVDPAEPRAMKRTLFRTRIKFCGLTRPGDVRLACELGVDAIGFVFAPDSPRRVEPEEARAMRHALAPLVDAVALFMDNSLEDVREVVRQVRPSLLQFHGSEDDAFCRGFGVPYLKAIADGRRNWPSSTRRTSTCAIPSPPASCSTATRSASQGGSGKVFDWSRIPAGVQKPFMLAGGLQAGEHFRRDHQPRCPGAWTCPAASKTSPD